MERENSERAHGAGEAGKLKGGAFQGSDYAKRLVAHGFAQCRRPGLLMQA
jgi:hypothetical protein